MKTTPYFDGQWFHLISSTYGSWLHGDPRGFRTRHHREHIDGDYKNPPPAGTNEVKYQRSIASLKQEPVVFDHRMRAVIGDAVRTRLDDLNAFVLCLSMNGQHFHGLVKFTLDADPRWITGLAKKHAHFISNDHGWTGKMWAKRGMEKPVRSPEHQRNVYKYILQHADEGAWVYDAMKNKYW